MEDYTENANGDMPLILENKWYLVYLNSSCANVLCFFANNIGLINYYKWFSTIFTNVVFFKNWREHTTLSVKRLFPVQCNSRKNMGNKQKSRCPSCIALEPHNFKILPFLLFRYDTPQLKNITIPAFAFSLHNSKLLTIR